MHRWIPLAAGALLCAGTSPAPTVQDPAWPHWRGPNRDMVSPESGWSVEGRPDPLWSANVGRGYSCVSIADGRLFTMGFDERAGVDRVYCLDPETGEERWRREWPAELFADSHGGGTLTTPSIEGDRVYVTNREGRGFCFRADDGEVLWEHDYAAELELEVPNFGFPASPLLIDGRLLLVLGDALFFCDRETGEVLGGVGDPGEGGYANPMPFELEGRPLLAVFASAGLAVHDRRDGEILWTYPWPAAPGVNCATPIVAGDRVLISSAYNRGSALVRLAGGAEPELLWRSGRLRNKFTGLVLWQDHVYGFDESMLKCLDLDGNEKWRVRGLGMGVPAIAGGRLLVLSSRGELIVAAASPGGFEELSRRVVLDGGVCWTPPVLLGGRIYCRNSLGDLVCLDHRAGSGIGAVSSTEDAPGEPGPLPDAAELFARHAELAGATVLRERRSVRIEGRIQIPGGGVPDSPMQILRSVPDRWLLRFGRTSDDRGERGFDGELAWELDAFAGNRLIEGRALREMKETLGFPLGVDSSEAYASMQTTARGSFGGRDCWLVSARTSSGTERTLYFDVETGYRIGRRGDEEAQVLHSDWRDFDGVRMPTRTTVMVADTGAEEIYTVSKVTWNTVAAEIFEPPIPILKLMGATDEIEARTQRLRERYAGYLGAYRADFPPYKGVPWRLLAREGVLKLRTGGRRTLAVSEPEADGRFVLPDDDATLTFLVDGDGRAHTMRFRTARAEHDLPRIQDE